MSALIEQKDILLKDCCDLALSRISVQHVLPIFLRLKIWKIFLLHLKRFHCWLVVHSSVSKRFVHLKLSTVKTHCLLLQYIIRKYVPTLFVEQVSFESGNCCRLTWAHSIPDINLTGHHLTSVIGRGLVLSTWHGKFVFLNVVWCLWGL